MSGTSGAEERAARFFAETPDFDGTLDEAFAAGRRDERTSMAAKWAPCDHDWRVSPTTEGWLCARCGDYKDDPTTSPPPEVAAVLAEVAREHAGWDWLPYVRGVIGHSVAGCVAATCEWTADPPHYPTGPSERHATHVAEAQAAALTAAGLVGGGTREVSDAHG